MEIGHSFLLIKLHFMNVITSNLKLINCIVIIGQPFRTAKGRSPERIFDFQGTSSDCKNLFVGDQKKKPSSLDDFE